MGNVWYIKHSLGVICYVSLVFEVTDFWTVQAHLKRAGEYDEIRGRGVGWGLRLASKCPNSHQCRDAQKVPKHKSHTISCCIFCPFFVFSHVPHILDTKSSLSHSAQRKCVPQLTAASCYSQSHTISHKISLYTQNQSRYTKQSVHTNRANIHFCESHNIKSVKSNEWAQHRVKNRENKHPASFSQ